MHIRIALALDGGQDEQPAVVRHKEAEEEIRQRLGEQADKDWAEDIAKFEGTSHITVWLDDIRTKFRTAAASSVHSSGLSALFSRVDQDGSGEVDRAEFTAAVRSILGVSETLVSVAELTAVFTLVDVDGSGEIDAQEFIAWLMSDGHDDADDAGAAAGAGAGAGAGVGAGTEQETLLKQNFHAASREAVESMGWQAIFDK